MHALHAQTEIAASALTSAAGQSFIAQLPTVEDLMPRLIYSEVSSEAEPPIIEQLISPNSLRPTMLISEYEPMRPSLILTATRQDYQRVLDYLKPIDRTSLVDFSRALVVRVRDSARSSMARRFPDSVKAVMSILFGWGVERDYLKFNPAEKVKNIRRPKNMPKANRPWSDEERHAVLDIAPSKRPLR